MKKGFISLVVSIFIVASISPAYGDITGVSSFSDILHNLIYWCLTPTTAGEGEDAIVAAREYVNSVWRTPGNCDGTVEVTYQSLSDAVISMNSSGIPCKIAMWRGAGPTGYVIKATGSIPICDGVATVDANGKIDFTDKSVTENTRVSYPIYHIENIVKPVSKGPHAKQVIFLSADAFGVLPPVSILNEEQAQYYFLSGFTAKLAGTERGITEPTPTFSACFGAAFLSLHPTKYAEELVKKMKMTGAKAYLVNTGWNGTGKRISIRDTRGIIDAILDGSIEKAPTKTIPYFDFVVPTELPGVDPKILDPRDTYDCACKWEEKAKDLAARFIKNFAKFTGNEAGKALVAAGPKL